jgi:hypothetical protein
LSPSRAKGTPIVTISWKRTLRVPRRLAGAISARYIGPTCPSVIRISTAQTFESLLQTWSVSVHQPSLGRQLCYAKGTLRTQDCG